MTITDRGSPTFYQFEDVMSAVAQRRGRAVLMSVAVLAAGAVLNACGSPEPTPVTAEEVPGVWCSAQHDQLTLNASGEFGLAHISRDYFSVLYDAGEYTEESALKRDFGGEFPTTGHGVWTFDTSSATPRLELVIRALGSFLEPASSELKARRDEQGVPGLYGYEGDPDAGYMVKFTKCR
ncbi:hypothetical protein [Micromonospora sp. WMMD736]|uniref:hypothetical protein n=1 Tax=Micromonospora sp. WMMD736 TaxID=3404112 RepID=UPI003B92556C